MNPARPRAADDPGQPATPAATAPAPGAGPRPVGLWRRLAALAYDAFLLFALLAVATALLLPLTGGEAVAPDNRVYPLYLLAVGYLYFGWCWTHGGQTLGMRAWHIRIRTVHGEAVPWSRAGVRCLAALLSFGACGAGFLWAAFDHEGRSWHDRLSRTVLETAPERVRVNASGAASGSRRQGRAR